MTAARQKRNARTLKAHTKQAAASGQLLFVATPIGNLADMSLRALEALKNATIIACEDTRHAQKLLQHYGIKKDLLALHDHNEDKAAQGLVQRVLKGETIAVISDAGLPLIADPGYALLQQAIKSGVYISVLPGANAALMALMLSGLPTDSFFFAGFLPNKSNQRQQRLAQLATVPGTLIFYESPQRLVPALQDIKKVFGNRSAAVARELTKTFEETVRGTLQELVQHFEATPPLGEIVIVVAPPATGPDVTVDSDALLTDALKTHATKQAAQLVAAQTGLPIRDLYARALILKGSKK